MIQYIVAKIDNGEWCMKNGGIHGEIMHHKQVWCCESKYDAIELCIRLQNEEGDGLNHYVVESLDEDGSLLQYIYV